MSDATDFSKYRKEFPICETLVYLNHAGVAPASVRVRNAVTEWFDRYITRAVLDEERWEETAEACRARFARLVGASADEIAFVRNTSNGLALVAEGLDWKPGDRVAVATELEYPSNVYVWQHLADHGVEVDTVAAPQGAVTPEAIEDAIKPQTRLIAVSSAQYATGSVTDLEAIGSLCRERNILFCVDGIQTVGALDIDVKKLGIHFLPADSHKWLLGMPGIGALYVSKDVMDRVRPVLVGWKSTTDGWNFDRAYFELLSDARKFEEGSQPYALIAGFHAALEILEEAGVPAIGRRIHGLIEHLAERLTALGAEVFPPPEMRHHILTFTHPKLDGEKVLEKLSGENFVFSLRRGRLRVSPHFYNTEEEMDRFAAAVQPMIGR
jgi:selenocysteine lyase/cysteine desulfurase